MSIIQDNVDKKTQRYVKDSAKVRSFDPKNQKSASPSSYLETSDQIKATNEFLTDFRNGWQTMHLPRPEFNDLSLYQRHVIDMLSFNTYQENDGNPMLEDRLGGWKSQAMRPVVRNKAISIAAHRTARLTVPKIFAYNDQSEEQEDSAKVMGYLLDWAKEQSNFKFQALYRELAAIYSPISWGYSEYAQNYRSVKSNRGKDGKWTYEQIIDENESGFQHIPVPTDQVFFSNFYERDVQKQDFIILRRVISYDRAKAKYGHLPNFVFVHGGIQVIMDDPNKGFYNVYDPHMRQTDVEEVIRWRKSDDSKTIKVNGVWMTDFDAANPRIDHQYPFDAFYYLPINERCIAGKSLVFALQSDATIINTFYQLILDGGVLNLFPPTITTGSDKVGADVIVPGLNIAFSDQNVAINPIRTSNDQSLRSMMDILSKAEASLSESSQDPVQQGQNPQGPATTAYEISRIEQNAATVLGFSMRFSAQHAIDYGKLVVSDILQYMTIADAEKITESKGLMYKTFFTKEPGSTGKMNKINFDAKMPDTMSEDEKLEMSMDLLISQGGMKSNISLWKVNPVFFRNHKYIFTVDEDVLNPRSADLERAFNLETYDRAIANPVADQEKIFTDLLMATNPRTSRDPHAYVQKQPPPQPTPTGGATVGPDGAPMAPSPLSTPPPAKSIAQPPIMR